MTVFLGNFLVTSIDLLLSKENNDIDYETINNVGPICEHGSNLTFGRCVLCDVKKTKKPIGPHCTHGEHPQLCKICMSERFHKAMTVCPHGGSLLVCRLCNSDEKYEKGKTYEGECSEVNEQKLLENKK